MIRIKRRLFQLVNTSDIDNSKLIHKLVQDGVDVNIKAPYDIYPFILEGYTPAMVAAYAGNTINLKALIDCHADINIIAEVERRKHFCGYKKNALMVASEGGFTACVALLLANGVNVEATDNYGRTAFLLSLHHLDRYELGEAYISDQIMIAKLLLQYKADINAQDHLGMSALHYVAQHSIEDIELAKWLLDSGIDDTLLDEEWQTALDSAVAYGRQNMVDFLMSYREMKALNDRLIFCDAGDNDCLMGL